MVAADRLPLPAVCCCLVPALPRINPVGVVRQPTLVLQFRQDTESGNNAPLLLSGNNPQMHKLPKELIN